MFSISIAGEVFRIENRYAYVEELCRDYIVSDSAGRLVLITDEEMMREKIPGKDYPHAYEESTAVYRKICESLITKGFFMFHASSVAIDGRGMLFAATSGTGKTTHARLWKRVFGDRVLIINDDKPLIRVKEGGIWVCGTPWSGKHSLQTNTEVPVRALFLLERGTQNRVEALKVRDAYPVVLNQTYRPKDMLLMKETIVMVNDLLTKVPVYRLSCDISEQAVLTAYSVLEDGPN